jgi:proteasome lid subunit RPN8/RPN11
MTGDSGSKTTDCLIIPPGILDEMITHCRGESPHEACGILAGKDREVLRIHKMTNVEHSPVSYRLDSKEQFRVMKDMRTESLSMVAIYHSHPSSPAYPSQTDVRLASFEDSAYVIVSLLEQEPTVRAFSIRDEKIQEIGIFIPPPV